jgi:hypothetical protein
MIIFIKVLLRPLKCIEKLLRWSAENLCVRYNKLGEGHGLCRTLGWNLEFPSVCGQPLKGQGHDIRMDYKLYCWIDLG